MAEIDNYQAADLSPVRERRNYAEQSNSRNPSNNKLTVNLGTNPFMDTIEEHNNDSVNEFEGWFLRPEEQSPQMSSRVNSREFIRLSPIRLRQQSSTEKQSSSKLSAPFTRKNLKKLLNQKEKITPEANGISSAGSDFTLHDSITDENPNVETKVMELNTNHSVSKLDSFKKNKASKQNYQQQILLAATQNIQFDKNPSINSQNNTFFKSTLQYPQQQQPFLSQQPVGTSPLVLFPFQDLKTQNNNRLHTEAFQKPADSSASKSAQPTAISNNQPQQNPLYFTSPYNESSSLRSTQLDDPINNNPLLPNDSSFFHFTQKPMQIQKQLPELSDFTNSQQPLEILTNQSIQIPDNSPQIIPLYLRIDEQPIVAAIKRTIKEPMRSQSTCVRGSLNSNPARALKDLRIQQQQQQTFVQQSSTSCINTPDKQQQQTILKQTQNKPNGIPVINQSGNENSSLQIAPPQFYLNSTNLIKPKTNNSLHFHTASMQNPASFSQNSVQVDLSQYLLKNPVASPSINQAKLRVTNSLHVESIRGISQEKIKDYPINNNKLVEQTLNIDYSSSSRVPVITPKQTQTLYTSSFTRNQNQFQPILTSSQNSIQSNNLLEYQNNHKILPQQYQQQQLLQQSSVQIQTNNPTGNNNNNKNNLKKWQINQNIIRDNTNNPSSSASIGEHQHMQVPLQHQSQNELQSNISHIDLESINQSRLCMKISEDQEKQFQLADSPLKSARIYSPEASPQINITSTPSSWHSSMNATSKQHPPINYNFNYKILETPSTATSFSTGDKQTATFKEFTKASAQGKPFYPLGLYSSKNPTTETPFYIQKVDDVLKQIKVNKPQSDSSLSKKAPIIPVKLLHSAGTPQGSLTSKYIK